MTDFAFVPGSTFHGDAAEVQEELDRLRRTGGLTPRAVVVAARSKRSVLHKHIFHVDAETAAERYYEHRATNLINAIVKCDDSGAPSPIRANIRVVGDDGPGYVSIDEDGARQAAISRIRRDMDSLRRQLRALELYPQLAMALDEALLVAA